MSNHGKLTIFRKKYWLNSHWICCLPSLGAIYLLPSKNSIALIMPKHESLQLIIPVPVSYSEWPAAFCQPVHKLNSQGDGLWQMLLKRRSIWGTSVFQDLHPGELQSSFWCCGIQTLKLYALICAKHKGGCPGAVLPSKNVFPHSIPWKLLVGEACRKQGLYLPMGICLQVGCLMGIRSKSDSW